jgi:NitT/TauT family transport system ATP-binding protein
MGPIIELVEVSQSYERPPVYVIHDVSLAIRRGEFFCLVGASGCGKSTMIKLMAGILQPTKGKVIRPQRVGMVFQSYALLPWLTVEDNVSFAARMQGFDAAKVRELTERYLKMVQLESFARKYPRELSGGQRQRVGIARALAVESEVLLLDEPFSALDPVIVDELHADLLDIWKATNETIVMVSHHFEEAVFLADRVGVIEGGRLKEIIDIKLPRPRTEEDAHFMFEVKKIRSCLSRPAEQAGKG